MIVALRHEGPEAAARFAEFTSDAGCELIVADGGADPAAAAAFEAVGASVIREAGNRGGRLARATAAARGDVFFFVHADSRPPPGAARLIRETLAAGADAGAFSLSYGDAGPGMRWIAAWANVRSRVFRLAFGDQGVFCRREAYLRAGGFRDLPICDDLDLVRRLARAGLFALRREKTVTSPRRYRRVGAARQVLRVWRVMLGYYAGVSPSRLARWYEPDERTAVSPPRASPPAAP